MKTIYHNNIAISVNRLDAGRLVAQCLLVSTGYEAVATIEAATDSFVIRQADWKVYRSPKAVLNGGGLATALVGTEAYLGAGAALRAVAETAGPLPKELLAECVKGIIQAETYLFSERGFASSDAYEAYWKTRYLNSCRLYSNLERVTHSWYKHVATRDWGDSLFNRFKTAVVKRREDDSLLVSGGFIDSFHELAAALTVADGVVTDCAGGFLRAPDPVCRENEAHFAALTGRQLDSLTTREIGGVAGGAAGCSHLADLLNHLAGTVRQADEPAV